MVDECQQAKYNRIERMVEMEKHEKRSRFKQLFFTFLRIGAFTFGGGYAMIPLIQREIVETHHWLTDSEMFDMFAIAESTPGVIAVNSATFVGYRVAGFWGAAIATFAVVLPSFVIISIISLFIMEFKSLKIISYAFMGIRAGVVVLILGAVKKLSKENAKTWFNILLTVLAALITLLTDISSIYLLLCAMVIGILYMCFMRQKQGKGGAQ